MLDRDVLVTFGEQAEQEVRENILHFWMEKVMDRERLLWLLAGVSLAVGCGRAQAPPPSGPRCARAGG